MSVGFSEGTSPDIQQARVEKVAILARRFQDAGIELKPYSGAIPVGEFRPETFEQTRDKSICGARHRIYIEPDGKTCYKTIQWPHLDDVTKDALSYRGNFPYLVNEALLLAVVNHPCIPGFQGCVLLRMAGRR
ncbi:hypothetical protein A2160_01330 [Candidatus Beckwithbacteria bacterium RBG_13_42_9]|uniref:Uncharacterized protein n=1 Tax=Candidatus Beckwithbacteria bacterium RBG_13_42_9 TaxID=1797457 RepID=A0A1F5E4D0_9BACT|nr:MAG: hypothetical protein A2160_01330 [Candidatus Beckwithbacteria bacterium RBG_13_42_9]